MSHVSDDPRVLCECPNALNLHRAQFTSALSPQNTWNEVCVAVAIKYHLNYIEKWRILLAEDNQGTKRAWFESDLMRFPRFDELLVLNKPKTVCFGLWLCV